MASMSDYLESGVITHLFGAGSFPKPSNISIALLSSLADEGDTGSTINEVASGDNVTANGYERYSLGDPDSDGDTHWENPLYLGSGSGTTQNKLQYVFPTALEDWGTVSGIALVDSSSHLSGNLLMYAALDRARNVYIGDNFKFNVGSIDITFK